jgi:hypothetical protein
MTTTRASYDRCTVAAAGSLQRILAQMGTSA